MHLAHHVKMVPKSKFWESPNILSTKVGYEKHKILVGRP